MALADDIARLADEIRQGSGDVRTEIATFPSGAASLLVRIGDRAFDLAYLPSYGMFGVDELGDDSAFDSGYRFGFKDFPSAREKLLSLLEAARTAAAHSR